MSIQFAGGHRGRPQPRAARCCRASRRPFAGGCGCGHGQDPHAGGARGLAGGTGRGPAAPAAADLLAPCCRRNGAPRWALAAHLAGPFHAHTATRVAMVRHLPQRRCAAVARRSCAHRSAGRLHGAGPCRRAGPDGHGPAAPGPGRQRDAIPDGAHLPGHPFALHQHTPAPGHSAGTGLPLVRHARGRTGALVLRPLARPSCSSTAWTTTTCCWPGGT
jgi:hypothetical protein